MGMFIHRRKKALVEKNAGNLNDVVDETRAELPSTEEEKPSSTLTIADIEKLPFFALRSLASQHGLDTKDKKANQIRKELIKKLEEERK